MLRDLFSTAQKGGGEVGSSAFSDALLAHLPRLRRYAIALVNDVSLADDLLQDCIERALRRQQSLSDLQSLYGWLRSILHNLYIDHIRYRQRRGSPVDIEGVANYLSVEAPAEGRGAVFDMVKAMETLSVEHREILLLVGLEEMSYRELSEELGIPIGTVMSRLARAREQLRNRLADSSEHDAGRRESNIQKGTR